MNPVITDAVPTSTQNAMTAKRHQLCRGTATEMGDGSARVALTKGTRRKPVDAAPSWLRHAATAQASSDRAGPYQGSTQPYPHLLSELRHEVDEIGLGVGVTHRELEPERREKCRRGAPVGAVLEGLRAARGQVR